MFFEALGTQKFHLFRLTQYNQPSNRFYSIIPQKKRQLHSRVKPSRFHPKLSLSTRQATWKPKVFHCKKLVTRLIKKPCPNSRDRYFVLLIKYCRWQQVTGMTIELFRFCRI